VKSGRDTLHVVRREPTPVDASIGTARPAFDAALARICAAFPTSHAVFDAADDSLLVANPVFAAEFGSLPSSRSSFEQRFDPVGYANVQAERESQQHQHAGAGHRVEVFCRHTGRWYAFHWTYLQAPDGAPLTLLSVHNLTERVDNMGQHRALQEQLLSSSRVMSVGEMATTLAHEINQPLASIVNCLTAARTLLERRGAHLERLRQAIDLAHEQAGHAASVVARIREFVRTREPRRECLPLDGLIERIVHLQQVDAQKNRVQVRVVLARGLPPVMADKVMIEQVLTNLMRNGIEAMHGTHPAQRILSINACVNCEERVEVRVADHGPGISLTEEAQLFTPFFTTKPHGMGIGLAICRSIVEFHEGHLYFERVPGGGSAFVFTLPPACTS
jgi:C4-dicarboxylate-specific signal transduction histidine kinase